MALKTGHQRTVVLIPFGAGRVDISEDRPHCIDQSQQVGSDLRRQFHFTVSEAAEQRLSDVGNGLQSAKSEETAGALDGVDSSKDTSVGFPVRRVLLETHQVLIELVEILDALGQKLRNDGIHPTHVHAPREFGLAALSDLVYALTSRITAVSN